MKSTAVDLFCGIGGLTYGLQQSGLKVAAGIDIDLSCSYAYEENNGSRFIHRDIILLNSEELKLLYPKDAIKILVGCAPCQPFSTYSLRYIKNGIKNHKWQLIYYFLKFVKEIIPDIVSIENVPQLKNEQIFIDFLMELEKLGYYVNWNIVNCADYGVPQIRKRLVLLASKLGPIELISPKYNKDNYKTVFDAIGSLPKLAAGETDSSDLLHRASKLSLVNIKRIQQSRPGGSWNDWDEDLKLACHKRKTGKGYRAIYGRLEWNKPAPTITTQFYGYGNGRYGHPEQDRALSMREGALLQSFPPNYKFINPELKETNRKIGIHIGNAVPVLLGVAIGQSILNHIKESGERDG